MPGVVKEIADGKRFDRLVVVGRAGFIKHGQYRLMTWSCRCDCGATTVVQGVKLRSGHTKSCGCYGRSRGERNATHGETRGYRKTAEFLAWASMASRCRNRYRERGIEVSERWHSFENFLVDMGRKPSPKHRINRYPDNNGNYEPGNCRWATQQKAGGY